MKMMNEYLNLIFKCFFFYFMIILALRCMGKREIGELSIFDIVIYLVMSELLALSLTENSDSILKTLIPLITLSALQVIVAFLIMKFEGFRSLIDGKPVILIRNGLIDQQAMKKERYNIDDLMMLCEADITSKNRERKQRFLDNFQLVRRKLKDLEEKDRIRNFQPPVSGEEIMRTFGLPPCQQVGVLKACIKDAILDGVIPNEYEAARDLMLKRAEKMGLKRVDNNA